MEQEIELDIWGKHFSLPVIFDCYPGETVTKAQQEALALFPSQLDQVEQSKKKVLEYITLKNECVVEDIHTIVRPDYLLIKHEDIPRVALLCTYRFDPEHGLAIVYSSDGSVEVGLQDIIL